MTFDEKYKELHTDFGKKAKIYLPLYEEINSIQGFGDRETLGKFMKAEREWKIARDEYEDFRTKWLKKQDDGVVIDPHAEYDPEQLL